MNRSFLMTESMRKSWKFVFTVGALREIGKILRFLFFALEILQYFCGGFD